MKHDEEDYYKEYHWKKRISDVHEPKIFEDLRDVKWKKIKTKEMNPIHESN